MYYPIKQFHIFILLILIIAGCDLSSAPELDKIELEPLFKGKAATIEFASDVDDSTKSHIVSFVSFGDSISTNGSGKIPSIDGLPFATFAINKQGETILGAMVKPNTINKIDQTSTAELLINLILPPGINASVSNSVIRESINNHPKFPDLVEEIRVKASNGEPLSKSTDVIKTAIMIADDIVISHLEMDSKSKILSSVINNETESSLAKFTVAKDIQIGSETRVGLGGNVFFSNNSYAPFLIHVSSIEKPLILGFKSLCFICFNPGGKINSTSIDIPYDGSLSFTAAVDKETIIMQMVLDFYSGVMLALGLKIPATEQTLSTAVVFINRAGILSSILQNGSASDVAKAAADAALGSTADFIVNVLEKNPDIIAKAGFSATINTFIPIYRAIQGADLATRMVLQGHATYQYWNMKPDKADACFEDGKLYGGCSHRVVIDPDSVTLNIKESVYLTATVYDDKNRILVGRKVDWLSSAPEVVTLLHKKADLNFATLHQDGEASIIAKSGGKMTEAFVKSVPDSTLIYRAAAVGNWTVTDPNHPSTTSEMVLYSDGTGEYVSGPYNEDIWPVSPFPFPIRWYLYKIDNGYRLFESGYWHPAYDSPGSFRDKLTYPISQFQTYNRDSNVNRLYVKK